MPLDHTPHTVVDIDPGDPSNIASLRALELTHAAPHNDCWKELAPMNIVDMSVTRETSHLDKSWLNAEAILNMLIMLVTRETSHFEMSVLNSCCKVKTDVMSVTKSTCHSSMGP